MVDRMRPILAVLLVFCGLMSRGWAADELAVATSADGSSVPYLLTTGGARPSYAVILMPGGAGILEPRLMNGKLAFRAGGNFLIRSRALFASGPFVAASTDATTSPDRILVIVADLQKRFGPLKVYVIGTSRSTES